MNFVISRRAYTVIIYVLVYLVTIGASLLSLRYLDSERLVNLFYANLIASIVIYYACLIFDNISLYDPYWSLQPICISFYCFYKWTQDIATRDIESYDFRGLLVFALVNVWAIRLTYNLFTNSVNDIEHEDWRYNDFRSKFPVWAFYFMSFLCFIMNPTVLVYFGCFPIHISFNSKTSLNSIDLIAFVVTSVGIWFEAVADEQLRQATRENAKISTKTLFVMDRGLWSLCRHPNYFGECTFWFGLLLFSIASGVHVNFNHLIGPVGILFIILKGSMPLMEYRQETRKPLLWKKYVLDVPYTMFPLNFFNYKKF